MSARWASPPTTSPRPAPSTTTFSALRLRRNILRRSSVGMIATGRWPAASGQGDNATAGVDADLRFFDQCRGEPVLGAHLVARPSRRRRLLPRPVQLRRRSLRLLARSCRRPGELQPGGRVRAPHRHCAERVGRAVQPAGAARPDPAAHVAGQPGLPLRRRRRRARGSIAAGAVQYRLQQQRTDRGRCARATTSGCPPTSRSPLASSSPPAAIRRTPARASYTLAQQRKVSGQLSSSYGTFYDGTRTVGGLQRPHRVFRRTSPWNRTLR